MYYVRYRDKIYADIGRIKRQQRFFESNAWKDEKKSELSGSFLQLFRKYIIILKTDLGIKDIINIMKRFRDIDLGKVGVTDFAGRT